MGVGANGRGCMSIVFTTKLGCNAYMEIVDTNMEGSVSNNGERYYKS